jgi:hypothetical protein
MNDEVKEILIDVIDYYNTIGTESDPGFHTFERVVQRASKALKRHTKESRTGKNSVDVDPFGVTDEFPIYKLEDEW